MIKRLFLAVVPVFTLTFAFTAKAVEPPRPLELSRAVRPWEFLSATGTRAGIFGNESGQIEAWVYPLKIFRDFHLRFHLPGLDLPAESLARTITVRPESTSILYASDTFTVKETFFVPVHEAGAIIRIDVDTTQPLEVEAAFQRDFQLEWPGSFTGVYPYWDSKLNAFVFVDELKRFTALIGSTQAEQSFGEYWTNYSSSQESSFRLGLTKKGRETKVIAISASAKDGAEAESEYRRLTTSYDSLLRESSDYYSAYLDRTVNLELPDTQLQAAYDWSRISMIQGLVDSSSLGEGLIAGYRTSFDSERPGFAWFFGRDALWTSFALDAAGDFSTTRTSLDFLSKYQRSDGKIPHEIAQSAAFVDWFKNYPYPYASADATPLFIIAMNDYVTQSGDVDFAREKWTAVWQAYQFLRSTYDFQGLPQNLGYGHGWIEGGPLVPVKTELYQSGLGTEALHSLSHLALLLDKKDVGESLSLSLSLSREFDKQRALLNQAFWSKDANAFGYALDKDNRLLSTTSVLATVPMGFGLLDETKAEATLNQLVDSDHQTDWGMRIISSQNPLYDPTGYHYGSVWPLFTGWASTGEYRYHRAIPAYANLRANAQLSFDGALGHATEVLSGDYYQPLLGSAPHQIWSAAMVVNPLLRGLLGLEVDAVAHKFRLAPHLPADWDGFQIKNVSVGECHIAVKYDRTPDGIAVVLSRTGAGQCAAELSPAINLRARVLGAEIVAPEIAGAGTKGHVQSFRVQSNAIDQHVTVQVPVPAGVTKLRIRLRNDFALSVAQDAPAMGARSQGLRIVSESWTADREKMTLQVGGVAGSRYEMRVWNPGVIASIDGAELFTEENGNKALRIQFPQNASTRQIVIHFKPERSKHP